MGKRSSSSSSSSELDSELKVVEIRQQENEEDLVSNPSTSSQREDLTTLPPEDIQRSSPHTEEGGKLKKLSRRLKSKLHKEEVADRKNPMNICFEDITYDVTVKKKFKTSEKQILKGITGRRYSDFDLF
jgi:hypothetical protein